MKAKLFPAKLAHFFCAAALCLGILAGDVRIARAGVIISEKGKTATKPTASETDGSLTTQGVIISEGSSTNKSVEEAFFAWLLWLYLAGLVR